MLNSMGSRSACARARQRATCTIPGHVLNSARCMTGAPFWYRSALSRTRAVRQEFLRACELHADFVKCMHF